MAVWLKHRPAPATCMPWWRRRRILVAALALAVVGGAVGWAFFAPKATEARAEAAPEGVALRRGTFQDGDPLHHASGEVTLLRAEGGLVLRFDDFEATSGPNVYVYLTPKTHASSSEDVEDAGVKIRTPTAMGQATLRGDFNLDVPPGVDPDAYAGVAIWCETYNVLFGYAELSPP